jgi:hypothetical protein
MRDFQVRIAFTRPDTRRLTLLTAFAGMDTRPFQLLIVLWMKLLWMKFRFCNIGA